MAIDLLTLKAYVGVTSSTDDFLLTTCIGRATSQVIDYCRRNPYGTTDGTVRINRFNARIAPGQALYLEQDLYRLDSLQNGNQQVIPTGSVWLEPQFSGPPYRIIRLYSSFVWTFNTDGTIQVTGGWGGWATVPDAVEQATIRQAAYLYRQKDTGITDVAGYDPNGQPQYTQGMPQDVRWLLAPYRSKTGGVV